MNPIATVLLLVGYVLAVPIASRLSTVVAAQHRLAMWGHQLGMMIAAVGWLFRGNVIVAIAHLVWVAFASVWFGFDPVVRKRRS